MAMISAWRNSWLSRQLRFAAMSTYEPAHVCDSKTQREVMLLTRSHVVKEILGAPETSYFALLIAARSKWYVAASHSMTQRPDTVIAWTPVHALLPGIQAAQDSTRALIPRAYLVSAGSDDHTQRDLSL